MNSLFGRIRGFLLASRFPNLIVIVYVQYVTARFLTSASTDQVHTPSFILLLLSTSFIAAGGYIINDYFDQKIDMINRPGEVIIGSGMTRRYALFFHVLFSATGIIIGFWIKPSVGVIHLFSSGMLWAYSAFIKRILLVSTFTISFLVCLTPVLVMIFFDKVSLTGSAYAIFGGSAIFVRETLKDIVSAKGEKVFGVQSVPIVWGVRGAKLLIYLVCGIGIALLFTYLVAFRNQTIRIFFSALVPVIAWFIFKLIRADRLHHFIQLKNALDFIILAGLVSILLI